MQRGPRRTGDEAIALTLHPARFPQAIIRDVAIRVDSLRAVVLAWTLPVPLLARIFHSRPLRLSSFFVASLCVNLLLALTIPLWIIVFGVLIQGVPHLVASVDFVQRSTRGGGQRNIGDRSAGPRARRALALGALFPVVAGLRQWAEMRQFNVLESIPNAVDLAAMGGIACWLGWASGAGYRRSAAAAALLGAFSLASFAAPAETLGGLILAHHFVGFVYWLGRAPTAQDRRAALLALVLLALTTAAILGGCFDSLLTWRWTSLLGGELDDVSLGSTIFPDASRAVWFSRGVSALALGQSMHYLVWLKAIPEQELPHQHPIGFAKSLSCLNRDVGPAVLCAAFYALTGLGVYALFAGLPEARLLYLAGAAFHGYFEIAGLAFIRRARSEP
jgi:hypothetical protein